MIAAFSQGLSRALHDFPPWCYTASAKQLTMAMLMTVTVQNKAKELVVPASVRRRAGIKAGDKLEFKVSGGIISIIPKLPSAADEYTPAQRRVVDAQLAEAAKGLHHGPFETAEAAIKFLNREIRKRKTRRAKTGK
jgi:AbrB family looped-hinge helix DNA binding protein